MGSKRLIGGNPEERRHVSRWLHPGSRGTRARPGTNDTCIPAHDQGRQDGQIATANALSVKSVRIPHGVGRRLMSSGLRFMWHRRFRTRRGDHATSLHYYAMTRALPPDIDPRAHRFMIHGLVDRPLTFTMEDKRLQPSPAFISSSAQGSIVAESENRSETHGMTSCRGLACSSTLLGVRTERRGILVRRGRGGGSEGRVEHADRQGDGRLHRGLRHERRGRAAQNGFPLRLMVPASREFFTPGGWDESRSSSMRT